jgi:6-phosphofructokinase 1
MANMRIGIFTGGGDCPGLNAVIRSVAKTAIFDHSIDVFGIEDGLLGLIENRVRPLTSDDVSNILTTGGTILGTSNKANPSKFPTGKNPDGSLVFSDVTELCVQHAKEHGLEAIVAIGGDGTMSACKGLVERGIRVVGVPKTIDNDLWGSDLTFGFLTAVATATDCLDKLHTTAASHHRVMVAEVMGRNAGWIALHAGVASGSDVILLPEIPFDIISICDAIIARSRRGKRYSILCVAEGASPRDGQKITKRIDPTSPDPIKLGGIAEHVADAIERHTGLETRVAVLGHVQRGGSPNAADRVLATQFGHHAMNLVADGADSRVVVMQQSRITDIPIADVVDKQRTIPPDHLLLSAARAVATSFGEP